MLLKQILLPILLVHTLASYNVLAESVNTSGISESDLLERKLELLREERDTLNALLNSKASETEAKDLDKEMSEALSTESSIGKQIAITVGKHNTAKKENPTSDNLRGSIENNPNLSQEQKEAMLAILEYKELENNTEDNLLKYETNPSPATKAILVSQPSERILASTKKENIKERDAIHNIVSEATQESISSKHDVIKKEAQSTSVMVIQKGDTLSDVALRAYGDPSLYMHIFEVNKDVLSSPHRVPENIELKIPGLSDLSRNKRL